MMNEPNLTTHPLTRVFETLADHPLSKLNRAALDAPPRLAPVVVPGLPMFAAMHAVVDQHMEPWRRVFASLPKLFPTPR